MTKETTEKMNPQNIQIETEKTDSEESNKQSVIDEGNNSKEPEQKKQSVEEVLTEIIQTNKITEDSNTEHVPQDTDEPVDSLDEEQNQDSEPPIHENDISSDQDDTAIDINVADGADEVTAAVPGKGEEIGISKIFEAIQRITKPQGDRPTRSATGKISEAILKMTQPPAGLPGQSASAGKSPPDITCGLHEICVNDIMQKKVTWASPQDSLQQAIAKMQQTDAGYIMIGQNGALEGIVSKSDIKKALSPYLLPIFAKWRRPLDDATLKIRIKWIMSMPVRTIKPQTSLVITMEHMSRFRGQCLPVMDEEGNVQGIVTAFDIFKVLLKSNLNTSSTGESSRELVETASSTETA